MATVRIGREEMESIIAVSQRMAERAHGHFVVDHDKVEIVEVEEPSQQPASSGVVPGEIATGSDGNED